jgi:hypothetical protein
MILKILLPFLILVSFESYAQCSIKIDTVTFFQVIRVDTVTKNTISSFRIFEIDSVIYYGKNFPFFCLECTEGCTSRDGSIVDYTTITNSKNQESFIKRMEKGKYSRINKRTENFRLKDCLMDKYNGLFLLKKQKAIVAFFIVKCKTNLGVADGVFCEERINMEEVPVILNVIQLL